MNDAMLQKAISLRAVSDLKPFDETIFAAVLVKAAEVNEAGDSLYFCELDGDLADFDKHGQERHEFAQAYKVAGITFQKHFHVP